MPEDVKKTDVDKYAQGKLINQVITFVGGYKTTFRKIKPSTIEQGKFTHFELEDGRLVLINPDNVLCIEVIKND